MGSSAKSYLLTLLLYVSVINEISLPSVNCQDEESQCLPRKTFFALLRLPEVSSNLAAYSRTARIIQDARNRNEIVHLKGSSSSEDTDDTEICLPVNVYLDLFSDPAMRRHLTAVGRAQRMFEMPAGRSYFDEDALLASESVDEAKRSIATLAKNGDLPITLQDKTQEEEEEEEKRSASLDRSLKREELEALVEELYGGKTSTGKRNVASLARDFALPPTTGKRNVGALARDWALPSGKRYLETLAKNYVMPLDKRNIAALARDFALPTTGKRNIAALARDYNLPSGKRYLDMFSRNGMPRSQGYDQGSKRNFAALVRSGNLPINFKKNVGSLARDWSLPTQNRFGRSLDVKPKVRDEDRFWDEMRSIKDDSAAFSYGNPKLLADTNEKKLEALANAGSKGSTLAIGNEEVKNKAPKKVNGEKRPKRQIDYTDEYPLPVMQNANVLDYEEMIEALADEYQNTEKRFMAADLGWQEIEEDDEPLYTPPPAKRHIGALARLGWLPSFRSARFSRSPRYLVTREDSADGTSPDNSSDTPTRSLGIGRRNHYVPSESFGDCRHGFKRYLLVPAADKILLHKFYSNSKSA